MDGDVGGKASMIRRHSELLSGLFVVGLVGWVHHEKWAIAREIMVRGGGELCNFSPANTEK